MSKKTLLKCDRKDCAKEGFKEDGFEVHDIRLGRYNQHSSSYDVMKMTTRYQEWAVDWCSDCCKKFGILGNVNCYLENRKPDDPKPITLEDMVREIVRQETEV